MPILEVALAEWPDHGGPVLLGRSTDPRLVRVVREHLAERARRELAQLEPSVRLVCDSDSGDE